MTEVEMPRAHEPMAPNEMVGNTSPKKRKVDEDGDEKPRKISSPNVTKKPRQEDASVSPPKPFSSAGSSTPLVQLKGRKLVFKQEASKLTPPSRRVIQFETLLLDAEEAGKKLATIPEEYWGLVAQLGHESTVRTEAALVKQIKTALTGRTGDKDILSTEAITPLISKLFVQNDYGFIISDFSPSSSTSKLPATLQLRFWEVCEPERYFSADQLAIVKSRVEERMKARAQCVRLLDDMDDVEKLELLKGDKDKGEKKTTKVDSAKTKGAVSGAETMDVDRDDEAGPSSFPSESSVALPRSVREGTANTVDSTRSARSVSPAKKAKMTPEEAEAARIRKEEKEARKQERAEKKAAEEKAAEKKKQGQAKQAQMFGSFFSKKPAAPAASPVRPEAGPSATSASPSRPTLSDYEKTFKPVQQRPNVEWAPINRWHEARKVGNVSKAERPSAQSWSAKDHLRDHLEAHGHCFAPPPRASLPPGLKSAPLFGTVADIWQSVEDAEDPRKVLAVLKDRRRFPWKVLAFDEDVRPPYCGTFAKKSIAVGGRTPFAQDPALDYGYDSAEDWVDDEGGEDVDDFGEAPAGSGDDEDEGEEEDEFDDWLDDSEDVGFTRPTDGSSDGSPEPLVLTEQSKLPQQVVKSRPIPKKVVKLKPFVRGPMWEEAIGEGSTGMQEYRLQLLNDTPDTLDPFTYTSSDPAQLFKTNYSSTVIGTNLAVKCLLSADPITSRPPVPPFDAPPAPTHPSVDTSDPKPASSRTAPKVAFPDSQLPDLLRAIEGNTKIRTDLVSFLREKFEGQASKAAIEAKLRDVAVRVGKSKDSQWKVHPEAWAAAGVAVPTSTAEPVKRIVLPLPLPGQSPFTKDDYIVDSASAIPQPIAIDSSSF